MISKLSIIKSETHNPYSNLSLEQCLMNAVRENEMILFLWQNENTVVIGRNQSAFAECNLDLMKENHVNLARRHSGGGAVYHDLGNLCFSFITHTTNFNVQRQLQVITDSLACWNLKPVFSGRNDILIDGKKFSGNAFQQNKKASVHHGTLLLCTDLDKMSRYLRPTTGKLRANGVSSVPSRVINLQLLHAGIEVVPLQNKIIQSAEIVFGSTASTLDLYRINHSQFEDTAVLYSSASWQLGRSAKYTHKFDTRFDWGTVSIELYITNSIIEYAQIFTDAMDPSFSLECENILAGIPANTESISCHLHRHTWLDGYKKKMASDIASFILNSNF